MLICPNCKKEFADGLRFCNECGSALTEVAAQESKNESEITEAPATETPATETPATETPATEAPATETPVTEASATETAAKKPIGDIAKELPEKAKQIPKKWLMICGGAVAGIIVVIILASLLFGPAKPNSDLEDAADNFEDEDYYVSYSDDEDELDVGVVEELYASDDGDDYLYVTIYATKKLADIAYDQLKLTYEAQIDFCKSEIKRLKYMIKKFEDELQDREPDSWHDDYDDLLEQYEEELEKYEDELEEYTNEYVFGQSGKKIWYGTKDAIKDSKG